MTKAKGDFELHAYAINDFSTEIMAKALAMRVTRKWEKIKDRYPVIDRYINIVIAQDIDTYERQGYVESYGNHTQKLAKEAVLSSIHVSNQPAR